MFRGTRVWKSLLHWPVVARIVLVVVAASIASPPSLMYNAFATSCIPDDPYACGGAGSGQTCCSGNCSSNCCNNSPCDGGLNAAKMLIAMTLTPRNFRVAACSLTTLHQRPISAVDRASQYYRGLIA